MIWALGAALVAVFALSAFFSGSETAFLAVRFHRLREMAARNRRAAVVLKIVADPERFLGAVLTGNVFVNALAGVLITLVLSADAQTTEQRAQAATLATLFVGAVLLVFGEMVPKSVAARHAERWAVLAVRPIQLLLWLLGPVSRVLSWLVATLLRALGISRPDRDAHLSAAEIRASVRTAPGSADRAEREVLARLADATGRRVTEVMTPRRAVDSVSEDAGLEEVLRRFSKHGHRQLPVVGASLDEIRGLLDLTGALQASARGGGFVLAEHLAPARFCPGSATLAQALVQMRDQDCRLLLVVDEHGGVEGIVSSASLMEAAWGPGPRAVPRDLGGAWRFEGATPVSEANIELARLLSGAPPERRLEIPPGDDYDTVGGFVLARTGHIPEPGEVVEVPGGIVRVEAVEGHRIRLLRVEPTWEEASPDDPVGPGERSRR